jgi:hypothetical protein
MKPGFLSPLLIVLALAAGAPGMPGAQKPVKDQLSGVYQGVAKMDGKGESDLTFVMEIASENGSLTGYLELEHGKVPLTGTYVGGAITIKLRPGPDLTINAKLGGTGDQITGAWQMEGGRNGLLEMKRVSAEWKLVHDMIAGAREETKKFAAAGGNAGDESSPVRKWANQLWEYGRARPEAIESKDAQREALRLLLRAGLIAEAANKTSTPKPLDGEWQAAVLEQLDASLGNKEYDYPINKADSLIEHSRDKVLKVRIRFVQGQAYWDKGDTQRAKDVFRTIAEENPNTNYAEGAKGNIYEIEKLNVGQPAPSFDSRLVNGEPARLADFSGKTLLLVFWASW